MNYNNGDYVSVRQGESILEGTLYCDTPVSLAEDETGVILAMTGPEYVKIETKENINFVVKASDILTPLEVLKMQRQQP